MYKRTCLLGCIVMALVHVPRAYTGTEFERSKTGRSEQISDVARCVSCPVGLPGQPECAEGRQPRQGAAAEPAILLCLQYLIALQTCSMALQELKNEKEQSAWYRTCLEARYFATEPGVCRRTNMSPLNMGPPPDLTPRR